MVMILSSNATSINFEQISKTTNDALIMASCMRVRLATNNDPIVVVVVVFIDYVI